jgi:hypothetical protein
LKNTSLKSAERVGKNFQFSLGQIEVSRRFWTDHRSLEGSIAVEHRRHGKLQSFTEILCATFLL